MTDYTLEELKAERARRTGEPTLEQLRAEKARRAGGFAAPPLAPPSILDERPSRALPPLGGMNARLPDIGRVRTTTTPTYPGEGAPLPPENTYEALVRTLSSGPKAAIQTPIDLAKEAAYKAGYGETRPDDIAGEADTQGAFADAARALMSLLPPFAGFTAVRTPLATAMSEAQAEGTPVNTFARAVDAPYSGLEHGMESLRDIGERQLPYLLTDDPDARSPLAGLFMETAPFGVAAAAPKVKAGASRLIGDALPLRDVPIPEAPPTAVVGEAVPGSMSAKLRGVREGRLTRREAGLPDVQPEQMARELRRTARRIPESASVPDVATPGTRLRGKSEVMAELLPPKSEGTVPMPRERAIEKAGGAEAEAARTGRVVVEQADGSKAIVPPDRVAEAQALAAEGRLAEIVNGEGNGQKPAAPTEVVRVKDAEGQPVRDVLTDTPEKTKAAVEAQPEGADVTVEPATPETLGRALEERGGAVERVPTSEVHADPARFQYKEKTGRRLRDVKKWDRDLAGVQLAWKDPADGKTYVVNGHHRLELAQRLGVRDIDIRYIDAANAAEARAKGALANIAEGQGSAVDAAKFFRDSGLSGGEARQMLSRQGVPTTSAVARDGLALANLDAGLFEMAATGNMPMRRAVAIGEAGLDAVGQRALAKAAESKSVRIEDIPALARRIKEAGASKETQATMFGDLESGKSLYPIEAGLETRLLDAIRADKRDFGHVAKRAKNLERGGNKIEVEASLEIADSASRIAETVSRLVGTKGPLSDAIKRAAVEVSEGRLTMADAVKALREDAVRAVREETGGRVNGIALDAPAPSEPTLFGKTPDPLAEQARGEAGTDVKGSLNVFGDNRSKGRPVKSAWVREDTPDAVIDVARQMKLRKDKPGLRGRLKKAWQTAQTFARPDAPWARAERAVSGKVSETGPAQRMKALVGRGAVDVEQALVNGAFDGAKRRHEMPSVRKALREMNEGRAEGDKMHPHHVSIYATAKRAESRYHPKGIDSGLDPAKTRETVAHYEKNHPEVVRVAEAMSQTYDAFLREMVDSGVISKKQYEGYKAENPGGFYSPFVRVFDDGAPSSSVKGSALKGTKMEGVKGGDQPILDPLVVFEQRLVRMADAAAQGKMIDGIVDWIRKSPDGATDPLVRLVELKGAKTEKMIPKFEDFLEQAKRDNPNLERDVSAVEGVDAAMEAYVNAYIEHNTGKSRALVFRDGKPVLIEFRDPQLRASLEAMPHFEAPVLMQAFKVAAATGRVFRMLTTAFSPNFQSGNLPRDMGTAAQFTRRKGIIGALQTVGANLREHMKSVPEAWRKVRGKDASPEQAAFDRLGVSGYYGIDRSHSIGPWERLAGVKSGKSVASEAVSGVKRALDKTSEFLDLIEQAPRKAEAFEVIRQELPGWEPGDYIPFDVQIKAATAGAEVTVPFKYGSQGSKFVSALYPFFSARLQANAQFFEMARRRPKDLATRIILLDVAPRLAAWMLNHDEEWYKRRAGWRLESLNVSENFAIPNLGIISLPGVAIERGLNELAQSDPRRAKDMVKSFLDDLSPIDDPFDPLSWVPQVFKPTVEVKTGINAWTDRDINPRGKVAGRQDAPDMVGSEYNSKVAAHASRYMHDLSKTLEDKVGYSPIPNLTTAEIDHLIGGYFGSVGRSLSRLPGQTGESEPTDIPVIGRFIPRIRESRWVDDFYKERQRIKGRKGSLNLLKREGDSRAESMTDDRVTIRKVDKIAAQMSELSKGYRDAKPDERRRIAKQLDELAKSGLSEMGRTAE